MAQPRRAAADGSAHYLQGWPAEMLATVTWISLAALPLLQLAAAGGCSTDADCSLNGVCKQQSCACDAAWHGAQCEKLSLLSPASVAPAYPPAEWEGNTTSWGGSVVKSKTGEYHMCGSPLLTLYVPDSRLPVA